MNNVELNFSIDNHKVFRFLTNQYCNLDGICPIDAVGLWDLSAKIMKNRDRPFWTSLDYE